MPVLRALPELVLARVVTAGGPYRPGDELSLALGAESIGRIVAHDPAVRSACAASDCGVVPELISVIVTHPSLRYALDDVVTLSFVDPHVARVHGGEERTRALEPAPPAAVAAPAAPGPRSALAPAAAPDDSADRQFPAAGSPSREREAATPITAAEGEPPFKEEPPSLAAPGPLAPDPLAAKSLAPGLPAPNLLAPDALAPGPPAPAPPPAQAAPALVQTAPVRALEDAREQHGTSARSAGVFLRLEWNRDRLRRFVQVVDKLFTIDRLGWYRHALAMRLLVPDDIRCGAADADGEAARHLHALRTAAVATLGKPLLAACMPNFSVTAQWLETIEGASEARAIAGLRDTLLPYVEDDTTVRAPDVSANVTLGAVARRELLSLGAVSVEEFLPILIAPASHDPALTRCLVEYRHLLMELFGQTAHAGQQVRLHQMTTPSHSLDDRLWQLVGAASQAFAGHAVA